MLRAEMKPTRNVSVRMTLESRNANPMAQPDEKSKWEIVVNLVMVQLRRETREGNPKVIQGERSRNTRKRRNISVSDSGITSLVKKKPSIDQHQCHVRYPSDAAVQYIKDRSSLPFLGASRGFCAKQNKKAISNAKRTRQREQLPVTRDEIKLVGMQRNRVDGSLEQNISIINKELMCCKN